METFNRLVGREVYFWQDNYELAWIGDGSNPMLLLDYYRAYKIKVGDIDEEK